jgi:transcription initiation factor TFIIB
MERPGWIICSNNNCRAEKGFREDIKTGDIVCTLCGRVAHEKVIDMGSEWRNFDEGENKSRAEGVDDISDKLTTSISTSKQEKNNSAISKLQQQISGNEQKALTQASSKIQEFGAQMNLPITVLKSAKKIYKDFDTKKKKRKIRGSNSDPFIVAVLYIACKENGLSRTFKELARETDIKEIEVRRMYKALSDALGKDCVAPVAPSDLVIRICSHLNLKSNSVSYLAQQIAKNVANRLEGKSPSTIAAASVLLAVKHEGITECTEREIAKAASISPSTVKNIYKDMEGMKDEIMPQTA